MARPGERQGRETGTLADLETGSASKTWRLGDLETERLAGGPGSGSGVPRSDFGNPGSDLSKPGSDLSKPGWVRRLTGTGGASHRSRSWIDPLSERALPLTGEAAPRARASPVRGGGSLCRPRVPQGRAGVVAYRAGGAAGACSGSSRTGVGSTGYRGRLLGRPGWGGGPTGMGSRTHRARGSLRPGAVRPDFGAGFRPGPRMYALTRLEM